MKIAELCLVFLGSGVVYFFYNLNRQRRRFRDLVRTVFAACLFIPSRKTEAEKIWAT
jgi:hypothetical protein